MCLDTTFSVYSFLSYFDSVSLLSSNLYLKSHKDELEKYCQHIQPHGKIEKYDRITKIKILEENYIEGKLEGIQKYWYKNGQLEYEKHYKNGKQEGIQQRWQENGQLSLEYNYKKGKQSGIQKYWYDSTIRIIPYVSGQLYERHCSVFHLF